MAKVFINSTDSPKDSRTPINNNFTELYTGANINDATEKTTPIDADKFGIWDSVSEVLNYVTWANIKATLKTYFDTLYGTSGSGAGWIALGACTYEGADDPTFTFSLASDVTGVLSVGMRIKLTQTTAKYFIITGVGAYTGGKTIITVYGGTDYDLANAAITVPYYSIQKAPFGFPLDPTKWTTSLTDTTNHSQASPVSNTWYNLGGLYLDIPIGAWNVDVEVTARVDCELGWAIAKASLSTTNNGINLSFYGTVGLGNIIFVGETLKFGNQLTLAEKTRYYLNECGQSQVAMLSLSIKDAAFSGYSIIRATCAYL